MPRPLPRTGRPASRPGQTRGGRRGRLEAFERASEARAATALAARAAAGPVQLPPVVTVAELAAQLGVPPTQVVKTLFNNGIMATINQALDFDTAAIVASDLGFQVAEAGAAPPPEGEAPATAPATPAAAVEDESLLHPRPPVVTIMGHVDHGKTTLLDAIRKARVAAGEAGGITQHIGAYQVEVQGRTVTFLDTPGHEAFTAMRARGAQATDIAVIVVAANDGVMPRTREAIDHARAAGVPIVVAINKMDLAEAQPERVKQELAEYELVVTEYGGTTEAINLSAKSGEGIEGLLETILLVSDAEVQPRANPDRPAQGVVIEGRMDKARGAVATLLVQSGTLRVGDVIAVGSTSGRVKALFDDRGERMNQALPAYPAEVLGLNGVPQAGDRFSVVPDERAARSLVEAAQRANQREGEGDTSVEAAFARVRSAAIKELNIIVKADVQGSVEPLVSSLEKIGTAGENRVKVIHAGLGNVNVTDVNLAVASKGVVVAFNVKAEPDARRAAEINHVAIRDYNVIYTMIEEIDAFLAGTLEPRFEEKVRGHAEVRQVFHARKRAIAGCYITDGEIRRRDSIRLQRAGETVWEGGLESLRRVKDDVAEVKESYECGILLDGFDDVKEGDVLEAFSKERV